MNPNFTIRPYQPGDERSWLQCRVLAFLETAYFDNVLREKESYSSPAIELVAMYADTVIGLLDIECETEPNTICSVATNPGLAGMIWHIAVHPDYRSQGIGQALLDEAKGLALDRGIKRFEAWTRDDEFVNDWYGKQGFALIEHYYHVYPNVEEIQRTGIVTTTEEDSYAVSAYCHYLGNDKQFLAQFARVHECRRYDLSLESGTPA